LKHHEWTCQLAAISWQLLVVLTVIWELASVNCSSAKPGGGLLRFGCKNK